MKHRWRKTTIGEACTITSGGTPSKSVESYWSGNIPWVSAKDLKTDRIFDAGLHISKESIEQSATKIAPVGSLLMLVRGMGLANGVQIGEVTAPVAFNQDIRAIHAPSTILPRFLLLALRSCLMHEGGERVLSSAAHGTLKIDTDALRQIAFPVPPLPEQRRIVGILDEAFEGIATAKANAEKNLHNARAIFESHLQAVFTQQGERARLPDRMTSHRLVQRASAEVQADSVNRGKVTKTGGREATLRHIPGPLSLAVGMPQSGARQGWCWAPLSDLARLESGHTPSRQHPEYWGGSIPWIGIQDAREHHGRRIIDTYQKTNDLGIEHSSARVLPENTVCLSRTASIGYVVVMGRPMATSQDFVNWVCTNALLPEFLKYVFLAEGRGGLLRYASGAVHQTIYFPEAKAFHVCHPVVEEQLRIVRQCDALCEETQRLATFYERKLAALDELKKSLLHQAFTGQL